MTLSLAFLGTGGGRFTSISQARATGGMYLFCDSTRMHIDPGPGALLHMRSVGIDPTRTTGIIITHCHPDHYTDGEILIEAMTHGCKKRRGVLAGSESVLSGHEDIGPAISDYHKSKPAEVTLLRPGISVKMDQLSVRATKTFHSDPTGVGLRLETHEGTISITGDTSLQEEVFLDNMDCDVLILSVTRPLKARISHHLSTEDAAALTEMIRPKLAILSHFGMKFITSKPELQAGWVEKHTGVRTVAAWDGMTLVMRDTRPDIQRTISRKLADSKRLSVELDDRMN